MVRAIAAFAILGFLGSVPTAAADARASGPSIAHGEFLVNYGGCQDCHTPGWAENGGHAARDVLLTGGGMNFQGPWGTTYAPNLRLYVQDLSAAEWIGRLRGLKSRPAMPYWTFRYLGDRDLADIYAYIRSLGPAGQPAHAWVPPDQEAPAPYLKLVLPAAPAAADGGGP
ncbi:c-type cytochrome [Dokdonella sp.]|uniref:c-type cytochrome n=1 Tax=Dokdonella sp. TaxID=2291710 RepID=UPI0031C8FFCF|nr:cytochrome C [Dokdonella sp.]